MSKPTILFFLFLSSFFTAGVQIQGFMQTKPTLSTKLTIGPWKFRFQVYPATLGFFFSKWQRGIKYRMGKREDYLPRFSNITERLFMHIFRHDSTPLLHPGIRVKPKIFTLSYLPSHSYIYIYVLYFCFWDRIIKLLNCPGCTQTENPLRSASQSPGITNNHAWLSPCIYRKIICKCFIILLPTDVSDSKF